MATPRKPAARKPATARKSPARTTRAKPERDGEGRFKPDHHVRNAAFSATALVGAVAAGVAAAFKFGLLDRFLPKSEGHGAEDLRLDERPGPDHRAPVAFRPDMTAPMSAAEKEALRPAPGRRVNTDAGTIEPL